LSQTWKTGKIVGNGKDQNCFQDEIKGTKATTFAHVLGSGIGEDFTVPWKVKTEEHGKKTITVSTMRLQKQRL
jgi:hypothetical protein